MEGVDGVVVVVVGFIVGFTATVGEYEEEEEETIDCLGTILGSIRLAICTVESVLQSKY